jgi:hypothetical protein
LAKLVSGGGTDLHTTEGAPWNGGVRGRLAQRAMRPVNGL